MKKDWNEILTKALNQWAERYIVDYSKYQSPIELIEMQMNTQMENNIIRVIQEMGIKVDKDELLQALHYDREQYEKGYIAGYAHRELEIVRCKDCIHRKEYECENIILESTKCGVTDNWFCADGERSEDE